MSNFFRRFWPWPKVLATKDQRIDALTFAVIRGEMTIQELQVKVIEQKNIIGNLELEGRRQKRALTERLTPYLGWDELHAELNRE
jgi:uncharacterized coiled-coil protein SlyX